MSCARPHGRRAAQSFFIDDLTRAPQAVHDALIAGAKAVRLRNPTHGLLFTAQAADAADAILGCRAVELAVPDPAERRALLDACGAADIAERCEGFTTPLELTLAARLRRRAARRSDLDAAAGPLRRPAG